MEGQLSPGQSSSVGNSDILTGRGMNDSRVCATGAMNFPDTLVVISGSGSDAHDAIEGAEFDSAGLIRFQSEASGVFEIGPLDHDVEMLAWSGLSAASEKLNNVFSIYSAQEKVVDAGAAKLSVDHEALAGRELDFLLPLTSYLDRGN